MFEHINNEPVEDACLSWWMSTGLEMRVAYSQQSKDVRRIVWIS